MTGDVCDDLGCQGTTRDKLGLLGMTWMTRDDWDKMG